MAIAVPILVGLGALVCAIQAIRAERLLISALWLAGTSALVSLLLYLAGAPEVAVVELSVGAGLVTVLFVFAISIAGDEGQRLKPAIPRWLAWSMAIAAAVLLAWFSLPAMVPGWNLPAGVPFASRLWHDRYLDILVQVALIFAGVLGVLGLLTEDRTPSKKDKS